jgi:hypothetical protein
MRPDLPTGESEFLELYGSLPVFRIRQTHYLGDVIINLFPGFIDGVRSVVELVVKALLNAVRADYLVDQLW